MGYDRASKLVGWTALVPTSMAERAILHFSGGRESGSCGGGERGDYGVFWWIAVDTCSYQTYVKFCFHHKLLHRDYIREYLR